MTSTAERKLRLCLMRRYEDAGPLAVTKHGSRIGGDVASRIGRLAADPVIVLPAQGEALEALVRAHSTSQHGVAGSHDFACRRQHRRARESAGTRRVAEDG